MPTQPGKDPIFDPWIVGQLACPFCLKDLRLDEDRLLCSACGRAYPIMDGIPVLIAERSADPSQTVSRAPSSTPDPDRRTE
jgi:uncharacterized protein YbaR (Trm112 family)